MTEKVITQDDLFRVLELKNRRLIGSWACELFFTEDGGFNWEAIRKFEIDTGAKVYTNTTRLRIEYKNETYYWG